MTLLARFTPGERERWWIQQCQRWHLRRTRAVSARDSGPRENVL